MEQLATFYWLSKMYKHPISSRFIAASNACPTKPLSQLLTLQLKLIITKHFYQGLVKNTGITCFSIIDKSMEILNK